MRLLRAQQYKTMGEIFEVGLWAVGNVVLLCIVCIDAL